MGTVKVTASNGTEFACKYLNFNKPIPVNPFDIKIKNVTNVPVKTENIAIDAVPKRFLDLMGDEQTFRALLKWLKTFKKGSPNIVLISGKTGLGKTCMVNLITKQAKYKVINVNYPNTNIAQINHSFGKCCIVFDELDVVSERKLFVSMIIKQRNKLQVPVICICNDIYEPSIRILKNYATVYELAQPSNEKVASRLLTICEKNGIDADKITMIRLVDLCNSDLRTCINALQLFTTKIHSSNPPKMSFTLQTLRSKGFLDFVSKNINASLPNTLEKLFYTAKGQLKYNEFESLAKQNDYDLVVSGILKNYPQLPVMDRQLSRLYDVQEWLELGALLRNTNDFYKQALFYHVHILYGSPKRIRFNMKASLKVEKAKPLFERFRNVWYLKALLMISFAFDNKRIVKAAEILKSNGIQYTDNLNL
eukprot:NODE_112_length_19362_cov_0.399678.p6 type:complete len:422 gc:universal NODE_112_length_19362_cov_0.399678:1618-2883(+)